MPQNIQDLQPSDVALPHSDFSVAREKHVHAVSRHVPYQCFPLSF
jgi:hypothetical protein